MYKHIIKAILITIIIVGCKKENIAKDVPSCIRAEIENVEDDANRYISKVSEYIFQGRTVYAFEEDGSIIADASTAIKDSACNVICSVGGLAGPNLTLCNGVKFYENAVFKRVIWEKK